MAIRIITDTAADFDAGEAEFYGVEEIELEKKELTAAEGGTKGNISDLGGYYNELYYFTRQAIAGAPIEQASLADAAASLSFLLEKEME